MSGLDDIAVIVAIFVPVAGLVVWLFRISYRFKRLEKHDRDDYEARCVLLKGMYAALDGLKQLGANGEVTEAEKDLREFIIKH